MDGKSLEAVRRFYERVDAAVAERVAALGLECRGCGACCHFDVVDHILYASGLERAYLRAAATLPENPDADAALRARGLRCPFQKDNRCEARAARVLGCRLHFCGWNDSSEESDFSERWHAELQALHASLGADWDYRPLLP